MTIIMSALPKHPSFSFHIDNLLALMARNCKLSNKDFALLVECPLSRDDYEAKLVAAGAVAPPQA